MHDDGIQKFRERLKILVNLPLSAVGCDNCKLLKGDVTQEKMQAFLDHHRGLGHAVWIERKPK